MAKKHKMPDVVLVTREQDGDEFYLTATDNMGDIDKNAVVGVYKLAFVRTMKVTRELV
jgi:hypothetical protein